MTKKEISEIKRQFTPSNCSITRICGCYVDGEKNKKALFKEAFLSLPEEDMFKYFEILRKNLSGTLGKNLMNLEFPLEAEKEGGPHEFLLKLRNSRLQDEALLEAFYDRIIETYEYVGNYLILLIHDAYDIPGKTSDGLEMDDASDEVYSYILCSICPVDLSKPGLSYNELENLFQNRVRDWVVGKPELGFLFPAFDDRAANIYNALFYSRKADELHQELIDAVFHTEPPMSPAEQKEAFQSALCDSLGDCCNVEVVQGVYERLREAIEQHKESKNPEPLALTVGEISSILRDCGVPESKAEAFGEKCGESFGAGAVLNPANLIDSKRFELKTADAAVSIDPERSYLMETQVINGRKYILVPADEGTVELNGFPVGIAGGEDVQS